MRACAQVRELTLRVERDDGILRQVVDELDLIRLTERLHIGHGLGARLLAADEGELFLADLLHLGLNGVEVLLREAEVCIKIVVPAAVDGRAMASLTCGYRRLTACAITWEQVCQYVLR